MPWPIGQGQGDGRVFSQSAERNKGPILEVLMRAIFMLYGKKVRVLSKKIAASAVSG